MRYHKAITRSSLLITKLSHRGKMKVEQEQIKPRPYLAVVIPGDGCNVESKR